MEQQSQQLEFDSIRELNEHLLQKFIRLALFSDVGKIPLKREDFVKKILRERSREFYSYMKEANRRLKDTFGLELVEIPLKDSEIASITDSTDSTRFQRPKVKRSNAYILRNTIDRSKFKKLLCRKHDYAEKGFLFMILSLILVHHQKLTEDELFQLLRRFNVQRGNIHIQLGDIDRLYLKLVKENYLTRHKLHSNQDHDIFQVIWGPRAHLEIKLTHMADAIAEIMGIEKTSSFIKQLERSSNIESMFEDSSEAIS